MRRLTSIELCAGAGGQALGLEQAGFHHLALVENDRDACATLRLNRPKWNVIEQDLRKFDASPFIGVDLVAGGLPCPPFSVAGKQLGKNDERNLFPSALKIIDQCRPLAVMIENVRGLLEAVFDDYRNNISNQLRRMGYKPDWKLINANDFGVPQLRPRVVFVAVQKQIADRFDWPLPLATKPKTVGEVIWDLMASRNWTGVNQWKQRANEIAPTIVGGSKKHGGPDLGPTRAKRAWAELGVDGMKIAHEAPDKNFIGMPQLTVHMVARLQGFPDEWQFHGKKTSAYRQVGNAFPPPVAAAVAKEIRNCIADRRIEIALQA